MEVKPMGKRKKLFIKAEGRPPPTNRTIDIET
jgi:hypothetical protein